MCILTTIQCFFIILYRVRQSNQSLLNTQYIITNKFLSQKRTQKQHSHSLKMQKSKRFNKKQSVRFQLVPGRDEHGNPTTMFKPVQTKSKLSKKQRQKLISQISDYEIEIDGKMVSEGDIPAFVLQQIKGRADLLFNQKNPDMFDMGQGEESKGQGDGMEYMVEEYEDDGDEEWEQGEIIPEEEYMDYQADGEQTKMQKTQQMPKQQQKQEIDLDGIKYSLTPTQLKLLDTLLPQNYQSYKIEGINFTKYDQDGNRLDIKQKYKKYIADPHQRVGIVDSYQFVPERAVDVVDDDMDGEVLKGDLKDVDDALNCDNQDGAYQELEDDFFSKLVGGDNGDKKQNKNKETSEGQGFKKKKNSEDNKPTAVTAATTTVSNKSAKIEQQKQSKLQQPQKPKQAEKKTSKLDELQGDDDYEDQQYDDDEDYQDMDQDDEQYDDQHYYENKHGEQVTDQMLDKALKQFNEKTPKTTQISKNMQPQYDRIPGTGVPIGTKGMQLIKFIQGREQCIGRDGQLDWRTLTKKQKKQYMKNKKIRGAYQEIKQREIQQKLKGKTNVKPEQLHLKQYIEHIPYNEDHVMQQAIQRDQKVVVDIEAAENQQDFETESEQDDIISYRAKTSIISSNLATVQQAHSKKLKPKPKDQQQQQPSENKTAQRIKVIPERRNREQTAQQRKQRKNKLKEQKKLKKQQRKQFAQMFDGERKKVMKRQTQNNVNNVLYKVSYVKIV